MTLRKREKKLSASPNLGGGGRAAGMGRALRHPFDCTHPSHGAGETLRVFSELS